MLAAVLTREPDWTALPGDDAGRACGVCCGAASSATRGSACATSAQRAASPSDDRTPPGPQSPPAPVPARISPRQRRPGPPPRPRNPGPRLDPLRLDRRAPSAACAGFRSLPPARSSFVDFALSPDGRQLAFTAASGGPGWTSGCATSTPRSRWRSKEPRAPMLPFWLPDARAIGFFSGGKLRRIDVAGGAVSTICDVGVPTGGSWSRDNVILYTRLGGSGLWRVPASGRAGLRPPGRHAARGDRPRQPPLPPRRPSLPLHRVQRTQGHPRRLRRLARRGPGPAPAERQLERALRRRRPRGRGADLRARGRSRRAGLRRPRPAAFGRPGPDRPARRGRPRRDRGRPAARHRVRRRRPRSRRVARPAEHPARVDGPRGPAPGRAHPPGSERA